MINDDRDIFLSRILSRFEDCRLSDLSSNNIMKAHSFFLSFPTIYLVLV